MEASRFRAITTPQSVAVFGSTSPGSIGSRVARNARTSRFDRDVWVVNPSPQGKSDTSDLEVVASLSDLPQVPDLAIVAAPASAVPGIIRDLGEAGCVACIVITAASGSDRGSSAEFDREVKFAADSYGVTLLGPNSVGLLNGNVEFAATFASGFSGWLPSNGKQQGTFSILSQSGGLVTYALSQFREDHLNFSKLVSTGNEASTGITEWLEALIDDADTRSVGLFIESVSDGARFRDALARFKEANKEIVLWKVGTSEAGRAAAESHSGRMAGSSAPYDALIDEFDLVAANSYEEFFAAANVFSRATGFPARRRRAGVVTSSGGTGIITADQLTSKNWVLPVVEPAVVSLDSGEEVQLHNPMDLGSSFTQGDMLVNTIRRMDALGQFDCIFVTTGAGGDWAQGVVDGIIRAQTTVRVPLIVSWVAAGPEVLGALRAQGILAFADPSIAVNSVARADKPSLAPKDQGSGVQRGDIDNRAMEPTVTSTMEVLAELGEMGVSIPKQAVVKFEPTGIPEDLATTASSVGYPVVLKLDGAAFLHKSELKAVRLGIRTEMELFIAFSELQRIANGQQGDARLIIQEMVSGIEVIVGGRFDESFGHVLLVGVGGVAAELMFDTKFVLAPATRDQWRGALESQPVLSTLLSGFRGAAPADVNSLLNLLDAVSVWAHRQGDRLLEFDLNPVIVTENDSYVVDARAVRTAVA